MRTRRRTRTPPQQPPPVVLLAVLTIVAGFVLAAVISWALNRGPSALPLAAQPSALLETASPTESPAPPSSSTSPASTGPSHAPPRPSPQATALPSTQPSAGASVAASTAPQRQPFPHARRVVAQVRATPLPRSAVALARPRVRARPVVPQVAEPDAVRVVRAYVAALARRDARSAATLLGGAAGDPGIEFTELQFIDSSSAVISTHLTENEDGSATVEAEISSAKGVYFDTFVIARGESGTFIKEHTFIKP